MMTSLICPPQKVRCRDAEIDRTAGRSADSRRRIGGIRQRWRHLPVKDKPRLFGTSGTVRAHLDVPAIRLHHLFENLCDRAPRSEFAGRPDHRSFHRVTGLRLGLTYLSGDGRNSYKSHQAQNGNRKVSSHKVVNKVLSGILASLEAADINSPSAE